MAKMKLIKEAVATVGTYRDSRGAEKKRFQRVGTLFEYDDGGLALKLDALPLSKDWSGFISFFDIKDRDGAGDNGRSIPAQSSTDDFGDDIPF